MGLWGWAEPFSEMVKGRCGWSLNLRTYLVIGMWGSHWGVGDRWLENVCLETWISAESLPGRTLRHCCLGLEARITEMRLPNRTWTTTVWGNGESGDQLSEKIPMPFRDIHLSSLTWFWGRTAEIQATSFSGCRCLPGKPLPFFLPYPAHCGKDKQVPCDPCNFSVPYPTDCRGTLR